MRILNVTMRATDTTRASSITYRNVLEVSRKDDRLIVQTTDGLTEIADNGRVERTFSVEVTEIPVESIWDDLSPMDKLRVASEAANTNDASRAQYRSLIPTFAQLPAELKTALLEGSLKQHAAHALDNAILAAIQKDGQLNRDRY